MMTPPNWLNALVLVGLLVALYMNWMWPWGLLFVYWAVPAIRNGETLLIGPMSRAQAPVLFWLVTTLWIVLGVMMILVDAAPSIVNSIHASPGSAQ